MPSKDLKTAYRKPEVAVVYDQRRFLSPAGRRRNRRKMAVIGKALRLVDRPGLVLDMPCGTGRFFQFLAGRGLPFVGADISEEMLNESRLKARAAPPVGLVVADAEALPFKDQSFDVVLCIRFLFHVTPEGRVKMLREMARVARGHLVLDYRLRFSLRNVYMRVLALLGLKRRYHRPTRRQMDAELHAAGLERLALFPVTPVFSDKHIVLCRPVARI